MVTTNERPEQMLKLLKGLVQYLPDMNVTISGQLASTSSSLHQLMFVSASQATTTRGLYSAGSIDQGSWIRREQANVSVPDVLSGAALIRFGRPDVSLEEAEEAQEQWHLDGWAAACPPNSALRSVPKFDERIVKQKE